MLDNYPSKNVLCLLLALCFDVSAAGATWSLACDGCKFSNSNQVESFWGGGFWSASSSAGDLCEDLCENTPSCTGITTEGPINDDDDDDQVFTHCYLLSGMDNSDIPQDNARSFFIHRQAPIPDDDAPTGDPTGVPGSCFHGDGSLLLKSGNIKKFSELSLGDEIKTSNGLGEFTYSSILTLPHKNNTEPALFVTLTTESGKKLDLTSDHFIPKCDQTQVTAAELVVGDCLFTIDGKETLVEVSSEAKNGVFTAITKDKYIVVDGVVASPFSKNTDPMKPELDYEKYRMELEEKRARRVSAQVSELQKKAVGHTSN